MVHFLLKMITALSFIRFFPTPEGHDPSTGIRSNLNKRKDSFMEILSFVFSSLSVPFSPGGENSQYYEISPSSLR